MITKPLEWDKCDDEDDPGWEVADTIVGRYSIQRGELLFIGIEHEALVQSSLAESGDLKAIAQVDFEGRIRSALLAEEV